MAPRSALLARRCPPCGVLDQAVASHDPPLGLAWPSVPVREPIIRCVTHILKSRLFLNFYIYKEWLPLTNYKGLTPESRVYLNTQSLHSKSHGGTVMERLSALVLDGDPAYPASLSTISETLAKFNFKGACRF
jgi:hypothetical protein